MADKSNGEIAASNDESLASCSTYFGNSKIFFPALNEEGMIPIEQFLLASQGIADFVDFLGTVFHPIKNDVAGNVTKVRSKFETDKERFDTIQSLVEAELNDNNGKLTVATEGLLWLKRGLEFFLVLIRLLVEDYEKGEKAESLVSDIRKAYDCALQRHHGFLSKQLFKLVIYAAPYRNTLLKAVCFGKENMETQCMADMSLYLPSFEQNVYVLTKLYLDKALESPVDPEQTETEQSEN